MTSGVEPGSGRARSVGSSVLLALAGGFLGYLTVLPGFLALGLVGAGVGLGIGLRFVRNPRVQPWAPVPVLVALATGALASPLGVVPELVAGGSALAFLVWLTDDPLRPAGGVVRGRFTVLLPAFALGIAWGSALLLPSRSASLGVAAGLLAFVIATLAYLVGRPELFDREAAATS
jgi:hypothetical protein